MATLTAPNTDGTARTAERPLRVCFFIASFADGGAQKQSIFLLNEFQTRPDVEVSLIRFGPGVHDALLDRDRLTVIDLKVRSLYDWRIPFKLRRALRKLRADILVSWLPNCDVPAWFVRRAHPGLRWIMTERNSDYTLRNPRFLARRVFGRSADAVVANSEKGSAYWAPVVPAARRFVVPNIVQAGRRAEPAEPPTIAIIGRLEPQKNVLAVIAAFRLLAARRPNLRFEIVGIGSLADAVRAAITNTPAIAYLGFRTDVPELIGRASVLVAMSHREGLPNVMLEAVAHDRLVVASDIPEHRELLGPDYPFVVAAREDPAAIAAAIEAALARRDDLTPLGFARDRVAVMSAGAIADRYLEIFRRVR